MTSDAPQLTAYVHRKWRQEYRGIQVEVCHWGKPDEPEVYGPDMGALAGRPEGINDGHGMWNYFLALPEEIFQDDDFEQFWLPLREVDAKGRVFHDYYVSPVADLEWHGGITFYAKHQDPDSGHRWVKLGCDYGHLWDSEAGYPYDKDWVWYDACRSVDKLHDLFTNLKRRCQYNGSFYDADQGSEVRPGVWYSFEGQEADAKWRAERC